MTSLSYSSVGNEGFQIIPEVRFSLLQLFIQEMLALYWSQTGLVKEMKSLREQTISLLVGLPSQFSVTEIIQR